MAIDSNKFIAFRDYNDLLAEGFVAKPGQPYSTTSPELMTKGEVETMYYITYGRPEWVELTNNQWVARWRMVPASTPSTGPSTPSLTTTYTPIMLNYKDWRVQHNWSLSSPGSYPVSYYELETNTDPSFSTVTKVETTQYFVGNHPSREVTMSIIDSELKRNCELFYFRMKAVDTASQSSAWSNTTNVTMSTDIPFFSCLTEFATPYQIGWTLEGPIMVSAHLTNNGRYLCQVQDNGGSGYANVFVSRLGTTYDFNTVAPVTVYKDEQVYCANNCLGGFLSDDGRNIFFITESRTVFHSYNSNGINIVLPMDFVSVGSLYLTAVTGTVVDIKLSTDYRKMFIADETKIYEYSLLTAWDLTSATLTATLNLSTQIDLLPGYTFVNIESISFIEDGMGLLVKSKINETGGYTSINVQYIDLPAQFDISAISNTIYSRDDGSFMRFDSYLEPRYFHVYPLKGIGGITQDSCQPHGVIDPVEGSTDLHTPYRIRAVQRI